MNELISDDKTQGTNVSQNVTPAVSQLLLQRRSSREVRTFLSHGSRYSHSLPEGTGPEASQRQSTKRQIFVSARAEHLSTVIQSINDPPETKAATNTICASIRN